MVKDGFGAIIKPHRIHFDEDVRPSFVDSLDADQALQPGREQENRWDYLLGHGPSGKIIGVEPHSAENSEIKTVIKKLESARRQLRDHLQDGTVVSRWFWVPSGKVHFAPLEKARLQLAQNGIDFVNKITNKHLK
ncbi:hypothetical protein ACFOY6_22500 [Pseudoroseomonas aestuarii]